MKKFPLLVLLPIHLFQIITHAKKPPEHMITLHNIERIISDNNTESYLMRYLVTICTQYMQILMSLAENENKKEKKDKDTFNATQYIVLKIYNYIININETIESLSDYKLITASYINTLIHVHDYPSESMPDYKDVEDVLKSEAEKRTYILRFITSMFTEISEKMYNDKLILKESAIDCFTNLLLSFHDNIDNINKWVDSLLTQEFEDVMERFTGFQPYIHNMYIGKL